MENKSRKKWDRKDQDIQFPINAPAVKEEILPQYGEHLLLLQERNRLIKKLKRKDKKQILLERKENGFALYVNGANADRECAAAAKASCVVPPSARQTHTAGDRRYIMNVQDLLEIEAEERQRLDEKKRARTAPSKTPRKTWDVGSVELTTDRGKRKLRAPEYLTGNYEDDFEADESKDFNNSSNRNQREADLHSSNGLRYDSDSDVEVDDSACGGSANGRPSSASKRTSYLKVKAAAIRKEEESNRLNLTIADVKKLRQSLEMNASIKQSLANDVSSYHACHTSSSSDDEEIVEEVVSVENRVCLTPSPSSDDEEIVEEVVSVEDDDNSVRDSPIEEEGEDSDEIEEELVPAMDSVCLEGHKSPVKNLLKPNDTIILEFAPPQVKRKIERNLSAPRKKDVELDGVPLTPTSKPVLKPLGRPLSSPLSRTPRDTDLKSVNPSSKLNNPLAVHRKNAEDRLDSKQEASAVLKALQAENKKAQHFSKESRPEIRPSSGTPRTSSSRLSTPVKSSSTNKMSTGSREGRLTDDKMHSIITKVLGMNPKQQRNLLKTLGKLEEMTDLQECRPPSNQPVKATAPVSVMHNNNKQKSSLPLHAEIIEVNMEIVSNWGSPSRLGLTELQFFDQDGHLIALDANDISVHGATGCKHDLDVLCNGKTKTVKDRYMWVCNFSGKHSVEFVIMLQNPSPHKHFEISTIKLWNYNKSINELDIGARHVRIFVGGELVFDGDVEKGCGNQVFDYCSVITVLGKDKNAAVKAPPSSAASPTNGPDSARSVSRSSQSSASSSGSHPSAARQRRRQEKGCHVRSDTRTLDHPGNGDIPRPTLGSDRSESSPENQEYQDNFKMPEKDGSKTPRKASRLAARLHSRSSETDTSKSSEVKTSVSQEKAFTKSPRLVANKSPVQPNREKEDTAGSNSPPNTRTSPSLARHSPSRARDLPLPDSQDQDDVSMMQKLKEMKHKESQRKKDIPTWLKSTEISDSLLPPGSGTPPDTGRADSRGKTRQADLDLANMIVEELEAWPQSGLNNDLLEPSPRSDKGEELDEITPMQKIEKKRSQWKKSHENLEEEWGGLNYFNKQQKGRLSIDMGDGDFDEYLKDLEQLAESKEPQVKADGSTDDDDEFVIPELPSGQELVINIVTTWGDRHYVGLTGIDIFSSTGESVPVKKITAKPLDINELPEYNKDPRVISNIIDSVNRTRDDVHMWLAPFTPGNNHYIFMTFDKPHTIAIIRFWNYNKSRIHSYRGAKDVVVTLDGKQIFKGEIARACGGIEGGTEAFGDTILFTMDENILELVSKNDEAFEGDWFSSDEDDIERPSTADNDSDDRPFTRAAGLPQKAVPITPRPGTSIITYAGDVLVYKAKTVELNLTATWGDMHYLGLTGLEIVGKDGDALPLNMKMVSAKPRDLHCLPGHETDDRTLDKLIDGTNITNSDEHMWLVPFTEGKDHTMTVSFTQQVLLSGLRIWNYNKSLEDTYRGARILHVKIDGRQVSPSEGYLVRKGPGNCHFDFAQEINFQTYQAPQNSYPVSMPGDSGLEYEVVQMPCGFIYQLQLFSTWGDQYYIGLNGLEFYDSCFNRIQLTENNITAYPDSVNVLENVHNDVRTPDKLIDGENSTMDGRHMWLAPLLPGIMNRVYVIFDQPTSISMIKIWNYSKTPARGTKDFALLVDDLLIYNGCLKTVPPGARGILPTCEGSQPYHTVLFTNNTEIIKREKNTIISNQPQDQDVQLLNDKKIVTKFSDPKTAHLGKPANQALRPKTSVSVKKR